MLLNNRIIFEDNVTLIDRSIPLSNISSETTTLPVVAAEDYLYIGSDLPFNHRYFEVSTANATTSAVSVSIWDGSNWVAAVDVLDQTSVSGKTLAQSGIISWATDRTKSWGKEDTTEDIPALASLKIYDMYWVRIGFSADLSGTTALQYVGHKFANDDDLINYYPDLGTSGAMTTYKAGKTNWNEQHVLAAEEIILKLRKDRKLISPSQLFDWTLFNLAAIHKCAEIIFRAFGQDYDEVRKNANADYHKAFSGIDFGVDRDIDGRLTQDGEVFTSIGLFRK